MEYLTETEVLNGGCGAQLNGTASLFSCHGVWVTSSLIGYKAGDTMQMNRKAAHPAGSLIFLFLGKS